MDWSGAIIPAQEPPPPPPEPRVIKKVWITLGAVLFLVVASAAAWKILGNYRAKSRVVPELIRETTTGAGSFEEGHPELFSASIEYNPANGHVTQRSIGKGGGDPPLLFSEKPEPDASRFIYKIEVISEENAVLQSGWYSVHKQRAETANNTIRLDVVTNYFPGAIVRVFLSDNQLIWTGKIE